ncbi:metallophosphoesterase [Piscinibacter gummiphilus]|uniref:Metallophosphoesterase n=1 Tax=Piscinibacter gummiphilus TaxID=946333 RepID=A0ABZ0CTQ8_9BURK|nr:metallophosphoesterase [Piscinibacter gummiphilus]WOB06268.1 metallophosphoesterase [Piscinibacter gummiphilus]
MRRAGRKPEPSLISAPRRAAIISLTALATLFVLLLWHDFRNTWISPGYERHTLFHLSVYWGLWLVWPLLAWLGWRLGRAVRARRIAAALVAGSAFATGAALAWARFIEPQRLVVRETRLGQQCGAQVALISDIHFGKFTRERELNRLVDRLNTLPIDAVLVAGDWTYGPPHDLAAAFAPLARIKYPVFGVLGNHDEQMPGPPVADELREALTALNVKLIDGKRVWLGRCTLIGIGDLYAGIADSQVQHLQLDPPANPAERRVVLTHNPDVATLMKPGMASLVLAGHTHGGQVYVPVLTQLMLKRNTRGAYEQGLYPLPDTRLYVTPGIGTDILPLRFLVPPTIDVLSL